MAENRIYVPDASVIIKLAVYESDSLEQAFAFKSDIEKKKITAITLVHCMFEVCNTLGRKIKKQALPFILNLLQAQLFQEYAITEAVAGSAFNLMAKYPTVSFYDAAYHALAINHHGLFITADENYYKKTHKEGSIQLLRNYRSMLSSPR